MNNTSLMTASSNRLGHVRTDLTVPGMLVASTKSGAQKLQLKKKKDFIDGYKKQHPDHSNRQASTAFDQYRVATLREFNVKLSVAIASGLVVAERLNADGSGDLRTISLVRGKRVAADKQAEAIAIVAAMTGKSIEMLAAEAKAHGHTIDVKDVTEIETSSIVDEAPANPAPSEPATATGTPVSPGVTHVPAQ